MVTPLRAPLLVAQRPAAALGQFVFLPPAWSISLERQLYLLAPLVLTATLRLQERFLGPALVGSATLAGLQLVGRSCLWEGFFPSRLFFFLLGMTIAIYSSLWPRRPRPRPLPWPPLLLELGNLSYSTYLIHWPILTVLERFCTGADIRPLPGLFLFLVGVPVILFGSTTLHYFVELPCIEWGRRIATAAESRPVHSNTRPANSSRPSSPSINPVNANLLSAIQALEPSQRWSHLLKA